MTHIISQETIAELGTPKYALLSPVNSFGWEEIGKGTDKYSPATMTSKKMYPAMLSKNGHWELVNDDKKQNSYYVHYDKDYVYARQAGIWEAVGVFDGTTTNRDAFDKITANTLAYMNASGERTAIDTLKGKARDMAKMASWKSEAEWYAELLADYQAKVALQSITPPTELPAKATTGKKGENQSN